MGTGRDTVVSGSAEILCTLRGYSEVRHCTDTLRLRLDTLGTAGMLGGWALHRYFVFEHCNDTRHLRFPYFARTPRFLEGSAPSLAFLKTLRVLLRPLSVRKRLTAG